MTKAGGHRDAKTGRYARRPVPDVDAESRFDPMGDDIPFEDVSGAPSPNTTDQPRPGPYADDLTQGGDRFPPRPRTPALISASEVAATDYGSVQGGLVRHAARLYGLTGSLAHVLGVDDDTAPSSADDVPGVHDLWDTVRPAGRGHGRGRDR